MVQRVGELPRDLYHDMEERRVTLESTESYHPLQRGKGHREEGAGSHLPRVTQLLQSKVGVTIQRSPHS